MIPTGTTTLGRVAATEELAQILARAYLRLRAGKLPACAQNPPGSRGNRPPAGLDVPAQQSDESSLVNSGRTS
jgi:hypothetical protein